MKSPQKAIVIGAGPGGLAAAIYLARMGLHVDIFEKQAAPGGRCGRITQGGHRFDLGATLLLMPNLFKSVFSDWGENFNQLLRPTPLDPVYRIFLPKGQTIDFTSNLNNLEAQLEKVEPNSAKQFRAYLALGTHQYAKSMRAFLGRNFYSPLQYFSPANAILIWRLKALRNHFMLAKKYFHTPALQAIFTFQNIYLGQSPFSASGIYALLPAIECMQGGFYPQGGMHGIVEAMLSIACKHKVRLHTSSPVTKIVVRQNQAQAVQLADGTLIEADIIVSNADLPYTNRALLPDSGYARRLERMHYTCSALVFHWGLKRHYPQCKHHQVFLTGEYRQGFEGIFKRHAIGKPPHFYLNHPSSTDPASAPAGEDSLSAIVPCGQAGAHNARGWEQLAQTARQSVLEELARQGWSDLSENRKFEILYTPRTWEQNLNLTRGAVFGSLAHGMMQTGYLRPANQHPKYSNLFFVGGSTHPGSGVPLTLLSARLATERILRHFRMDALPWHGLEF